jgi:uncharacterized membrane protein
VNFLSHKHKEMNQRNILTISIITGIAITVQLLGLVVFGIDDDWLIFSIAIVSHVVAMIVLFGIHNWLQKKFYMPPFSIMLSIVYFILGLFYLLSGFLSTSPLAWEGVAITLIAICPISIIGYFLEISRFFGYDFRFDTIIVILMGTIYYFILGKIIERFTVTEDMQKTA